MDPMPHRLTPPDFSRRWTGAELMDDPACDETQLLRTVDQFESINFWVSRYRSILTRWVLDDMRPGIPARLVDLGAGGCEIAAWLLRAAARRGLTLTVIALDPDPRIASHARKKRQDTPGLEILEGDTAQLAEVGPVDYLFCNHVLHHIPDAAIPGVLRNIARAVTRRWIVSDLLRSRWAWLGFQAFGRCYRNSFAFEDGLRSIRRGFTVGELLAHARIADLGDRAIVVQKIPGRLVMLGPDA